jgi:hypothetical protein
MLQGSSGKQNQSLQAKVTPTPTLNPIITPTLTPIVTSTLNPTLTLILILTPTLMSRTTESYVKF